VTVVYPTDEDMNRQYEPGNKPTVIATLAGVLAPEPGHLTWEQVLELRHDEASRKAYRRFVHWLDAEMVGKSPAFIADEIGSKRDAYERALKKHGVKSIAGVLSRMFEPKWVASATAAGLGLSAAGQEYWGAVSAATVIGSALTVSVVETMLGREDVTNGDNSEIAFVHDVVTKAKSTG
jgi:hypothetical protein